MKEETKKISREPSYYSTYLRSVLSQMGSEKAHDDDFVFGRAEQASAEYEEQRRGGMSVFGAQECAMKVLLDGIG